MKRLFIFLIPIIFLGCKNTISYELRNLSSYDAVLIDQNNINKTEYFIKANTTLTIEHYDNGHFVLKDNIYPIEVFNGFSSTSIKDMATYEVSVNNTTDKQFELMIQNSKHSSTASFIITSNYKNKIIIYVDTQPNIVLKYNSNIYENFIINNSCLVIY